MRGKENLQCVSEKKPRQQLLYREIKETIFTFNKIDRRQLPKTTDWI